MSPEKILQQKEAELEQMLDWLLENLNTEDMDGTILVKEVLPKAEAYKMALLNAAEVADIEIAEHYRLLADQIISKVQFFVDRVGKHRWQHGLQGWRM